MAQVAVSLERILHRPGARHIDVPCTDLLTFLFESEHCAAKDDTVLHIEAANPVNKLTKGQLHVLLRRIAHSLRSNYGIGRQQPDKDIVTVITYGQNLTAAVFFGVLCAGGVYSAASPSSTTADLVRQLKITRSKLIVCGREHIEVATRAAAECGLSRRNVLLLDNTYGNWRLDSLDGSVNALDDRGQQREWKRVFDQSELRQSLAMILWSSGTTGLPKPTMLSHTNLVTEVFLPASLTNERAAQPGKDKAQVEYRTLGHLPISHIAGACTYLIRAMYSGGSVYWMRRYSWTVFLSNLEKYQITTLFTVPSIWLRIAKSPEVSDRLKNMVAATTGAASMDGSLQRAVNKLLGDGKGVFVGQTWGLSETTGAVTWPDEDHPDDTGSIGCLLPNVEIRLVDQDYHDVEMGEQGEMLVRSPLVFMGYYGNEEATKECFHGDWFCSGDIGVVRDGKLYIVDRKKDIFKYKGLQVAPAEIENVLFSHPEVQEAAVIGVPAPDAPGTEWPRAYVVPVAHGSLTESHIKQYVKDRLADYKRLRGGVVFVDEIPKNAAGKFLRRVLMDKAKTETLHAKLS